MTQKDLTNTLVQIHNLIADVAVKGDNAILVGNALQGMRGLIQTIVKDGVSPEKEDGGDTT